MSNRVKPRNTRSEPLRVDMMNGGRWHHIASDEEIARAMRDPNADICEWHALGKTFVASHRTLTIVRTSAMGGDTFDIEGGWVYSNDIALRLDGHEIRTVADNVRRGA